MNSIVYRSAQELNDSMIRVYANMFSAVVNSMIVSYLVSNNPALMNFLFDSPLKWLVIFAPLACVFLFSSLIDRVSQISAFAMLHGFAALMGLSLSTIFVVYTSSSIFTAFMGAAVLFGTMSLWGYFTGRSLENWRQFLFIGVIAIVVAAIVNLFIGSTALQMTISSIAIIIFSALTAADSQQIRESLMTDDYGNTEISGALRLYLNFINIFVSLLQLIGDRKE